VALPELPSNRELPVHEILEHTACELRDAFRSLTLPEYSRSKAERWLIAVSLTPKVDDQLTLGGSKTWKSTALPSPKQLITWVLGTSPGVQLDAKSQSIGAVTYNMKSAELIRDNTLYCDRDTIAYHTLTRHLGIGQWLRRTVSAMDVSSTASIDKPSFTADISIKFTGGGSYTYAFPLGSDLASLSGNYSIDEKLEITMTEIKETKTFSVVTLPTGQIWNKKTAMVPTVARATAVEDAQSRLDLIQIQQSLSNLRVAPE
jgi:hypothetical protein